eukprot:CAMPEP_0202718996 /NCGR_PEP_ID=MMETSP1385-20130828/127223_1 /ASSEMBLY_ACC=CAM_ASM_000861 /TAXON_ID=933848 /ORGANISM="Elphidium margaritaceum" /LENGTH=36 /DNA_ID= /DNA_START= /DNA_END= /DNA_ORIENTATION=
MSRNMQCVSVGRKGKMELQRRPKLIGYKLTVNQEFA